MLSLTDLIAEPNKRAEIIDDCVKLVDQEVGDKGGLSGLAIKTVFGAVKGVKPGFIKEAVGILLPEFAKAIDPLFQEAQSSGKGVSAFMVANPARVSAALLSITDAKVKSADNAVLKSGYDKLRGMAPKQVEAALPRLGALLEKHAK